MGAGIQPVENATTLTGLDGLLLAGGTDVNPSIYGAPRQTETDQPDQERDRLEIALLREALKLDLPVFAICRGIQRCDNRIGDERRWPPTLTQRSTEITTGIANTTVPRAKRAADPVCCSLSQISIVGVTGMIRVFLALILLAPGLAGAERRAKNVILFLGDAAGIPTLHAASLYKYNDPQKLFIQNMPYIALSDTSPADGWVTDSAAGMSAIVTGQKTNNGVISQSASAIRGKKDGEVLQTILEHAEQRGLSTGVMSNMVITDATTAACYAHSNDRSLAGEIFAQVLKPRFGDGVDVIIGAGRTRVFEATAKLGIQIEPALREKGYAVYDSPTAISDQDRKVVALLNTHDFDVVDAMRRAIRILSKNRKGYFLMVEWDAHTDNIRRGLKQANELDAAVREAASITGRDTLILFTADHSFDLRVRGGRRGQPLLPEEGADPPANARPAVRMDNGHTGEQVLVAAQGPGARRVRGFLRNADLFGIMMAAYGWK